MLALLKKIVKSLPFDFTRNQQYDTQTRQIFQQILTTRSNCIDVGCHKGEMLDLMLAQATQGEHFCFEPLPDLFAGLLAKNYPSNCHFFDLALSNQTGETTFNYVISNPAYSGLLRRQYDRPNEEDTQITVKTALLDDIIPPNVTIDLIKIDVEGAEMLVLQGATELLKRCKPIVVFEHGLGASDVYGTQPSDLYDLLTECGLKVSLLKRFLRNEKPLTKSEFEKQYFERLNYYFIAY
jgi:FkbM family methyltransferase